MRKKLIERLMQLKGVIFTLALAVTFPGTQLVFAEEIGEMLDTVAAVTPMAQQDGQLEVDDAALKGDAGKHSGQRQEFFRRFLENHPRVKERLDRNGDGKLDRQERTHARNVLQQRYRKHNQEYDNNPPGQIGGAGTNWENPVGIKGGPGASPDRFQSFQRGYERNFHERGRAFGQSRMGDSPQRGFGQRNSGGNFQGQRGGHSCRTGNGGGGQRGR